MSVTVASNGAKRASVWSRFRDVTTLLGIGVLVVIWFILQ